MLAVDGSIFIGTNSCFRLGSLKSGMFSEVESNVKMTWCRLQDGDGEVENGEQGEDTKLEDARGQREAAWLEEAGGEGKAAGVDEARPGRGCQVGGGCRWQGKDGKVEIVRWRWRSGRNHRLMLEEWRHPGSVKVYGETMSLVILLARTFSNRVGH